jgi:hypothetical protein
MNADGALSDQASAARLRTYVELLENALLRSQLRGDPGNWYGLRRQLRAIAIKMTDKTSLRIPDWAYELEIDIWVDCLRVTVLPEVLDRLVDRIHDARYSWGGPEASDRGVWAPLARGGITGSNVLRDGAAAEAALLGAYRQHREKASPRRLGDAIQALKDLVERARLSTASHGVAVLSTEGEYLAHALRIVFPSTARLLLAMAVRRGFEAAVKNMPVRQLPESRALDWYRKYPGLDRWRPIWVTVDQAAREEPGEDEAPNLFVHEAQQVYVVTVRDRRKRDKKGQERT